MGAFLLAGGTKGKRLALPHSKILIHQPLGGAEGQASDIAIAAEEILKTRKTIYELLAEFSGQKIDQIEKDADRDKYFTAKEAKDYGLVDKVVKTV
jgi:ATP-dependent Clp protease protease subunit